ncbi:MAG TPA: Imm70 family immunity protein [Thermoanaerobaculales bacterium]|nr:Imm70 family immunity protein [Thermoanaerobaculales bacterium]HPA79479.1 Imm70 family immunity protein [Thermoanaerobaculales bacterium]
MSLYLTVFSGNGEVDGWVLGHYSDFDYFRECVGELILAGSAPLLMEHSDCDGEWEAHDLPLLRNEIESIAGSCKVLPPRTIIGAFEHTRRYRSNARSLYDCFHNVDGTNLFQALIDLCDLGISLNAPILFQ